MIEPRHDGLPRRHRRRLHDRHVPAHLQHRREHQVAASWREAGRTAPGASRQARRLVWLILFRLVLDHRPAGRDRVSGRSERAEPRRRSPPPSTPSSSPPTSASLAFAAWLACADAGSAGWPGPRSSSTWPSPTAVVALTGWSESVFVFMFLAGHRRRRDPALPRAAPPARSRSRSSPTSRRSSGWRRAVPPCCYALRPRRRLRRHRGARQLPGRAAPPHRRAARGARARPGRGHRAARGHRPVGGSGLVTLDAAGRITFLNRAGEQITGLRRRRGARPSPPRAGSPASQEQTGRDETDFDNVRGERLRLGYTHFPLRGRDGTPIGQRRHLPGPHRAARHGGARCSAASGSPTSGGWRPAWPTSCATRSPPCPGSIELLRAGLGAGARRGAAHGHRHSGGGAAERAGHPLPGVRAPGRAAARADRPGAARLRHPGGLRQRPGGGARSGSSGSSRRRRAGATRTSCARCSGTCSPTPPTPPAGHAAAGTRAG